ncbi:MAG: L-histidine N(alpha)-methyltransferase, partial [Myxococcales bacterium]|nr:L-histidine N(alpha)-methyltransferase [Myxococcales bacterium]
VSEYFDALRWLNLENSGRRKLVLMLGSNIGNFNPAQTRVFMRTLWNACNPGDLVLTGFDLKKDIDIMLAAYNDREGVTRDFNLNLLRRINRELDGNFNLAGFQHFGTYNVFSGAMESYLVSLRRQEVAIGALNKSFSFAPWEPIFVEYSFKFLASDIEDLAQETGFRPVGAWQDQRGWFCDALWRVHKELV